MKSTFDVVVVGAGFAGTILARALVRRGRTVLLVDRGRHPRFAFGESSTPLAALLLERLAAREGLDDLRDLATWGRWSQAQQRGEGLRGGLKRGFTFYHHGEGGSYRNGVDNEARLLVAASPDDTIADLHHLRADVDAALFARAVAEGVVCRDHTTVVVVERAGNGGWRLEVDRRGVREVFSGTWLVDATGPAAALATRLGASAVDPGLDTAWVGAHVEGLPQLRELARSASFAGAPYPEEAAAVHHLVADGWLWVLRFDHGVTSVGLVADRGPALATARAGAGGATVLAAALSPYPELAAAFAGARIADEGHSPGRPPTWVVAPRGASRLDRAVGEGWLALPHTYTFADPMFSTGLATSLLGVERALAVLGGELEPVEYELRLRREADRTVGLIRAAQVTRPCFAAFCAVTWAYFVAVSWTEIGSRLGIGRGELDHDVGFLGVGDAELDGLFDGAGDWPGLAVAATNLATGGFDARAVVAFQGAVRQLARGRDLVGITDLERPARNLHDVDLELLVERAGLLGLDATTMRSLLPRLRA